MMKKTLKTSQIGVPIWKEKQGKKKEKKENFSKFTEKFQEE